MGKINVLPFEVANLIAAGEVVDRPSSVIKELLENAIDAGSTEITVEIQNGGVSLMRVSDNGCGMDKDDLRVAVRRHATSKIKNAEDLDGILTLGFRGEALAAIAAVSEMRIISKTCNEQYGAMLEVSGGQVLGLSERGCPQGTTVVVENLFKNVPARRKFLKRDATETMAVGAVVEKIALSHPEIAFRFICDGTIKTETLGDGNLRNTIYSLFGREYANSMIEVNNSEDPIFVHGFIGRSDNVKSNRNYENFFINGRYVRSKTISAALEQAYTSYMPPEKFPCCVLCVDINPQIVDVNVHPAKLEVKFSNEKPIFEAVYYTVRTALELNITRPAIKLTKEKPSAVNAFVPIEAGSDLSVKKRQLSYRDTPALADYSQTQNHPLDINDINIKEKATLPPYGGGASKAAEDDREDSTVISAAGPLYSYGEGYSLTQQPSPLGTEFKDEDAPPENPEAFVPAPFFELPDLSQCKPIKDDEAVKAKDADKDRIISAVEQKAVPTRSTKPDTAEYIDDTKKQLYGSAHDNRTDRMKNSGCISLSSISENDGKAPTEDNLYRIVGELFNSYIIVEKGDTSLLIDKHAAHERIIFERLKASLRSIVPLSQMLMIPIEVMLASDEVAAIDQYRTELEAIGFSFSCGKYTVNINAVPEGIEVDAVSDMLMVIADRIKNETGNVRLTRDIIFEKALYQASCKAAIKAGQDYSDIHIEWIVDKLMTLNDITFCPHGRPVAIEMSKKVLDKQFERT